MLSTVCQVTFFWVRHLFCTHENKHPEQNSCLSFETFLFSFSNHAKWSETQKITSATIHMKHNQVMRTKFTPVFLIKYLLISTYAT
jgi:hypothetical protein